MDHLPPFIGSNCALRTGEGEGGRARERSAIGQNAFSLSLFTVKWSDLGLGRCGVRRLRLLRLAPVAAARHALHANEFQANQYPFPALPASLSLSLLSVLTPRLPLSLLCLREGGGNGARSIFEICNCRGFYSVC